MATFGDRAGHARRTASWRFVATIFAGTFLLFLIQPMIARMALPRLGGAPAVWNSAMLVYQGLLLAGYAYAHWLSRLGGADAGAVQSCRLRARRADAADRPERRDPAARRQRLSCGCRGCCSFRSGRLFLVVSAQAPLMQRWYALVGRRRSLSALRRVQSRQLRRAADRLSLAGRTAGAASATQSLAGASATASCCCSGRMVRAAAARKARRAGARETVEPPRCRAAIADWIVLAAIPSGLMLSTTLHLTTDIVAMPLLWVVPLGLYLLSFSVAFAADRAPRRLLQAARAAYLLIAAGWRVHGDDLPSVACLRRCVAICSRSRLRCIRPVVRPAARSVAADRISISPCRSAACSAACSAPVRAACCSTGPTSIRC